MSKNPYSLLRFDQGKLSLEQYLDSGKQLSAIALWPLYFIIRNGTSNEISRAMPLLSVTQREFLIDLDCWDKQDYDLESFEKWMGIFYTTQDIKLCAELVTSDNFKLYLKGKFNLYTFENEHPVYPDHDNFFITDDFSFLIEYEEKFKSVDELKYLLSNFYAQLGVEKAQLELMTIISESYFDIQEAEYNLKRDRLDDVGYVDYYEALKANQILGMKKIEQLIKSRLTHSYLSSEARIEQNNEEYEIQKTNKFESIEDQIKSELIEVEDPKILKFLPIDYIRTLNARFALNSSLKKEDKDLMTDSLETQGHISLGFDYLKDYLKSQDDQRNIFEFFSFKDLALIGRSLIEHQIVLMKKVLKRFDLSHEDHFIGDFFIIFLQDLFDMNRKIKMNGEIQTITTLEKYQYFKDKSDLLLDLASLMKTFKQELVSFKDLRYLNYTLDEIDFEALLLTRYLKFQLRIDSNNYGVSKEDFQNFIRNPNLINKEAIKNFIESYKLDIVDKIELYLEEILIDHFGHLMKDGINVSELKFTSGVLIKNNI